MKRMLLGLGLGLGLLGCVPIPPGTSQVVPFELVSGRIPTITAGQSWYLAKRYDEIQWVARIIFDAEGRVRSRSIRAVSTPVTLTWSQAPDEVLWDFANSGSLFLRCTGTGLQNEYQSWPTWFYVASAQLPPGWQVEAFPTNGVLQCGPGSKEFSGIGNSRVIVQAIPFATFYRFTYVVQVPSNAQPGSYILRWTVFDRHQGKLVTEETTVVVNA